MNIQFDGATRLFGIVGDPISQTPSPQTVTPMLQEAGMNAILVPFHVPAGHFDEVMRGLKRLHNFCGTMVTYPFKAQAVAHVDRLLPSGKLVGAINTMRREPDGSWTGEAFDGQGLVAGLRKDGVEPGGKRILLLGAGGAGSAIAFALAETRPASLDIFDIERAKANDIANRVKSAIPDCRIDVVSPNVAGHDIVINATPVGMKPDDGLPLDAAGFHKNLIVVDIVPKPDVAILREALRVGCRAIDFRTMARGQMREIARFFGAK